MLQINPFTPKFISTSYFQEFKIKINLIANKWRSEELLMNLIIYKKI